ncbi:MAG: flagellar hook-basal body protein [Lachnospiraceae bacterium]|nr:flagellar hook-basal body protein [Lachnospiraceae bacterium]
MVRSLWSAATGMNAQQTNVDTIANNLANVNTTGYKAQVAQFKSLLYQNLQTPTTTANGDPKPTGSQVGLGVRTSSINNIFTQGAMLSSQSVSAVAIQGAGFFAIQGAGGETHYTRNGDFTWALSGNNSLMLTTSDGNAVLDTNGRPMVVDMNAIRAGYTTAFNSFLATWRANNTNPDGTLKNPDLQEPTMADLNTLSLVSSQIAIDAHGGVNYFFGGIDFPLNMHFGLYQFANVGGLERIGSTLFRDTAASGPAMNELTSVGLQRSQVAQNYLEGSNVYVADEMVNLIVAQRAYEMNSKAITTSDEMMQTANNLKR